MIMPTTTITATTMHRASVWHCQTSGLEEPGKKNVFKPQIDAF